MSLRKVNSREVAAASILGGLAALLEIIIGPPFDIPFPLYPKISWDFTGIPMMISLFFYGPVAGVYTSLVGVSIIFFRGNLAGGVFKLVAELTTLIAYAAVKRGLIASSIVAVAARVLAMTIVNYYLLQFFYGMPEPAAVALLAPIAVFNATQALVNIIPAYLIFKRIKKKE